MDDEILVAGSAVCKQRAGKTYWLLVRPGKEDSLQLPKVIVRRGESSVRAAIRSVSEMAGIRGKVLEEAGRTTVFSTRDGKSLFRRIIYYLMQQRGKDENAPTARVFWSEFIRARSKLSSLEQRILAQARTTLTEWQQQQV